MESRKRTIKFNLFMNMLLTTSAFIFPLITFPYITRVLQPEGTGKIAFANSVISYFSMFALLGIPTYGIRACAQVRDDKDKLSKTAQEIWILNFITTIIASAAFVGALICVPRFREEHILMLVCSTTLILNLLAMEWLYKALECYSYITMRSLFFKVLAVLLMYLTVKSKGDYIKYAGISVLANTGYGLFNFINFKKYIIIKRYNHYNIKKHLKPVLVFFAMSVATTIYTNLDTTMLGFMKGDIEVGYYDVAIKIKVILVNLVTSLGVVLLPRISYYVEKKMEKEFWAVSEKALEFVFAIAIPLIVSFIIMAPSCILLLSGADYLPSITPMRIIMPTLILIGMSNIFGIQILVPLGKEKYVLYSEIAGAATNVIFNMMFIPRYGAAGAALGTLIAEAVVLAVQIGVMKEISFMLIKKVQFFRIGGATVGAGMVLLVLYENLKLPIFLLLTVCFGVFFMVYGILLLIMKERIAVEVVGNILSRLGRVRWR